MIAHVDYSLQSGGEELSRQRLKNQHSAQAARRRMQHFEFLLPEGGQDVNTHLMHARVNLAGERRIEEHLLSSLYDNLRPVYAFLVLSCRLDNEGIIQYLHEIIDDRGESAAAHLVREDYEVARELLARQL